jgi:DNA helicase HerA-like ATPase
VTGLRIGTLLDTPDTVAELIVSRFNRHTFWCGQSGSGKTYALGVVLEQLLIHTGLPMVILDPNADFVRLSRVRPGRDPAESAAITSRGIRVLDPAGDDPLRVRFLSLPLATKAAILRIDPIADRVEYNALLHIEEKFDITDKRGIQIVLYESDEPIYRQLAQRIENLGLMGWGIWAFDTQPATAVVAERPDATVVNLGGFEHPDEPLVVALSILEDLWARRQERRPILIVIDEAHNFCAPDLEGQLAREVRAQITRIAAEGRKYGLWLLLSTQRPSRIHPSILSQCDNLALMKMASPTDLAELMKVFGFAPEELVRQSPAFRQGQALFAGGFAAGPQLVQMRERITEEGGADVTVPVREASAG